MDSAGSERVSVSEKYIYSRQHEIIRSEKEKGVSEMRNIPKIGDKVTRLSFATRALVAGTVVYVNEEHGWYRVEYTMLDGSIVHECFPFYGPVSIEKEGKK